MLTSHGINYGPIQIQLPFRPNGFGAGSQMLPAIYMTEGNSNKVHWDNIYGTKSPHEVSWTEDVPEISLSFIHSFNLPKTANIIDIGGGESRLASYLLDDGFVNVTVLDISERSIEKAKKQLGKRFEKINWIVQDIIEFRAVQLFDCWHDRAAFHFLTTGEHISKYAALARQYIKPNGYMVVGTFSEDGPEKCSGLSVRRYSEVTLANELSTGFQKLNCITKDHITPFNIKQNFVFCSFKRN